MSVVKMSKFSLTGLASEKDALLDARIELAAGGTERLGRRKRPFIGIAVARFAGAKGHRLRIRPHRGEQKTEYFPENTEGLKDDILLSYDDFMQISGREAELTAAMEKAETLEKELSALRAERVKAKNLIEQLSAYREVNERFFGFFPTRNARAVFSD